MTSTRTYDFLTDSDYSYTAVDIALSSGQTKLALQDLPEQVYAQPYTSDTGFTYDDTKLVFSGTQLEHLQQAEPNISAYASYDVNEDFTWGDSSLTGTLNTTATVSGGNLVVGSNGDANCNYVITGAINAMKGAIRMAWIPDLTGNTPHSKPFFVISDSLGSDNNKLVFRLDSSSAIRMDSWTNVGVITSNTPFGTLQGVAGVERIIEFNWDFTPGSEKHEVYVDGVQQGATQTTIKTRDNNLTSITYLQVGGRIAYLTSWAQCSYNYIITATEPLHTSAHTTPIEPSAYRYAETCATSAPIPFAGALDGVLVSIEDFTATHTNPVRFNIGPEGGPPFWYNTVSENWEISDGAFIQANTDEEMKLYLPGFPFTGSGADIVFCTVFPQSVNAKSSIDNLNVEYTSQAYPETNPVISIAMASRIWATALATFIETTTIVGSDAVKYIMVLSGTKTWWTGSVWAASNGSYSESNTAADITTNIATLVTDRKQIGVDIFLHSDDGTTSPIISNLIETYTEALPNTSLGRLVDISGYIYDNDGPVSSEAITVKPYRMGFNVTSSTGSGAFFIYEKRDFATTVSDGFFSGQCYLQSDGNQWEFKIGKQSYRTTLLDQDFNDFNNDLTLQLVED